MPFLMTGILGSKLKPLTNVKNNMPANNVVTNCTTIVSIIAGSIMRKIVSAENQGLTRGHMKSNGNQIFIQPYC